MNTNNIYIYNDTLFTKSSYVYIAVAIARAILASYAAIATVASKHNYTCTVRVHVASMLK